MKLTSMQKMIAVIVAIVIAAVLVVVFLIMPQFSTLSDLDAQLSAAQLSVQQAQATLTQLESVKQGAAITDAELLKGGTEMPDSPQLPTLIIELQDIAAASGVTVTHFGPSQPTPGVGGQFTEVPIALNVNAHWDDLLDYLRRINESTRLLRITTLGITPPTSTSSTETVTEANQVLGVTINMKAYVIGNNGVLGSQGATATAPAGQ